MLEKKPPPSVIAASFLAGALLAGYFAGKGAISAGHDPTASRPFPDITGLFICALATLACPIFAVCVTKLLSRVLPRSPYRLIFAALVIPPLMAFPMGSALYRRKIRNDATHSRRAAEFDHLRRVQIDALQTQLIADPEIALRERWFE
ncbi:hypothetical protein HQ447_01505 [bacterium]|nr:hypothetical protein [bacterium]